MPSSPSPLSTKFAPRRKFLITDVFLTFLLLVFHAAHGRESSVTKNKSDKTLRPKIIGGSDAPVGRFPYMCSLRLRGNRKHSCGATLIHPRWILTAAHCVDPVFPNSVGPQPVIYCGIHEIDDSTPNKVFTADSSVLHPRWNGRLQRGYDIAMLKLDRKADSPIPDILSRDSVLQIGTRFAAIGWGRTESSHSSFSLRVTQDLSFVPANICGKDGGNVKEDIMLCAGLSRDDTCEGDSGGPLLQADTPKGDLATGLPELDLIVGITSASIGECGDTHLGIYTHVGHFSAWIQSVIKSPPEEESEVTNEMSDIGVIIPSAVAPEEELDATASVTAIDLDNELDALPESFANLTPFELLLEMLEAITYDESVLVGNILDEGIDPNARFTFPIDREGRTNGTLLHWAARFSAPKSTKVLLDYGASTRLKNLDSNAPLHYCGLYNSSAVAQVLIEDGANVDISGHDDFSPLHFAARNGSVKVAKVLLRGGANTEARDTSGRTPLHEASRLNGVDTAKVLLGKEANVGALDDNGASALHFASYTGSSDAVEILLEYGAEIDFPGPGGETALHLAARQGHLKTVRVLVEAGASTDVVNEDGDRPFDVVCSNADPSCSEEREIAITLLVRG